MSLVLTKLEVFRSLEFEIIRVAILLPPGDVREADRRAAHICNRSDGFAGGAGRRLTNIVRTPHINGRF